MTAAGCATAVWHTDSWTAHKMLRWSAVHSHIQALQSAAATWRRRCGGSFCLGASLWKDAFMAPPPCEELLLPCWHALVYPKAAAAATVDPVMYCCRCASAESWWAIGCPWAVAPLPVLQYSLHVRLRRCSGSLKASGDMCSPCPPGRCPCWICGHAKSGGTFCCVTCLHHTRATSAELAGGSVF